MRCDTKDEKNIGKMRTRRQVLFSSSAARACDGGGSRADNKWSLQVSSVLTCAAEGLEKLQKWICFTGKGEAKLFTDTWSGKRAHTHHRMHSYDIFLCGFVNFVLQSGVKREQNYIKLINLHLPFSNVATLFIFLWIIFLLILLFLLLLIFSVLFVSFTVNGFTNTREPTGT